MLRNCSRSPHQFSISPLCLPHMFFIEQRETTLYAVSTPALPVRVRTEQKSLFVTPVVIEVAVTRAALVAITSTCIRFQLLFEFTMKL